MVSQGILGKLDDANVNAPEWLNSFVVVKKPNGKLCICLNPTDLNPYVMTDNISCLTHKFPLRKPNTRLTVLQFIVK